MDSLHLPLRSGLDPLPPGFWNPAFRSSVRSRRRAGRGRDFAHASESATRKRAEGANRIQDEFLTNLAHELRTPLNSILGWAQLLAQGALPDAEIQTALDTIVRNAETQARLIEDLLDVGRIESGRLRVTLEPTDLAPVLLAASRAFRPMVEEKSLRFEVDVEPRLPRVQADGARIQQVVGNLLGNAIKFTPEGGLVRLSARREGPDVSLCVADTGCGIPAEFLPHVFERWQQADASSTRSSGGLGIGLAIVRELVLLHRAKITVESAGENRGSTFTVRLPIPLPGTPAS